MTTSRHYTLIAPRADYTGPCNVAVDIGRAALDAGYRVSLLYLSGRNERSDLDRFEVRRWRWRDVLSARGIVHTHCLRPDLVGWLFSWNRACRVITTLHNHFRIDLAFDHPAWLVRIAYAAWSRAIARFDARVCVSDTMRRYYRRTMPELSFDVAYNFRGGTATGPRALDDRLDAWLSAQAQAGRTLMAYVGSLSPRKNLRPLLDAVARVPTFSLVVCGAGPEREALERQIRELHVDDRVLLAGQIAAPERVVARSHLLVLPSLAEGLPLVALEALKTGRPCLLSNIAVHRELARAGLGVTFDRHGFRDFVEKAALLVSSHTPAGEPDPRLTELYRTRFSEEAGFARYERLFVRLTEARPPGAAGGGARARQAEAAGGTDDTRRE